jgi:hypothetical protein
MRNRAAVAALCLAASACHTFAFHVSDAPSNPVPVVDRKTYWLFGTFPEQDIDAGAICPEGVSKIAEETLFTDVLLTAVTLEIYAPRTSTYYCRLPTSPVTTTTP